MLRTIIRQIFSSTKCFLSLFSFFFIKIAFSLQKEEDFWKPKRKFGQISSSEKGNFGTDFQLYSIYLQHICCRVKNWSIFLFFFDFENLVLPAERRGFFLRRNKKDPFLALKTGPTLLRNILGPVFNASLDQFLTLGFLFFLCFVSFIFG